ncbi:MAG: FAD-dependent thymidylate synthase [Verrucomicrobia bacterium]|nr:FAD-dependent thymidylate synthase [Verrucomicrobiota bacterium]
MRIVREPQVYVVGRQTVDQAEVERFLNDHALTWQTDTEVGAEVLCEAGGRLCYMSYGQGRKSNKEYLAHLVEVGHGSVLEHAVWNLLFTGISRSCTHELVRHRAGFGYSQLSQRYVDESDTDFVEPDVIADDPDLHALWMEACGTTHRIYCELVERLMVKVAGQYPNEPKTSQRKIARQAARSVLPNATETKVFVTANARALRHFIEMRAHPAAEVEIRKLAVAVLRLMQAESPNIFGDYEIITLPDGTEAAATPHRKV